MFFVKVKLIYEFTKLNIVVFHIQLRIFLCVCFARRYVLLGVCDDPLGVLGGFSPFPGCGGGGPVGCVQGRGLSAHASPSGVFPARRL